jgi:hypothetical protein
MTEIVDHREFLPRSASRPAPAADNRTATLAALQLAAAAGCPASIR